MFNYNLECGHVVQNETMSTASLGVKVACGACGKEKRIKTICDCNIHPRVGQYTGHRENCPTKGKKFSGKGG